MNFPNPMTIFATMCCGGCMLLHTVYDIRSKAHNNIVLLRKQYSNSKIKVNAKLEIFGRIESHVACFGTNLHSAQVAAKNAMQ